MSIVNVIHDIVTGNFSDAAKRIEQWWSGLRPELQAFVETVATAEGQILQGLVATAAQDVISGGLTTASFVAAAKDVEAKLIAQNITMGRQTIFSALNAVVASTAPHA